MLVLVPITLGEANEFVRVHHRHHEPVPGHKFSIGVYDSEQSKIVGVAIVGRPVARHFDDGFTLEVNRTCTDGTRNANSMLYGACTRASFALGYRRLITYTQEGESGASLKAANWRVVAERKPNKGWNVPSRPRVVRNANVQRTLWSPINACVMYPDQQCAQERCGFAGAIGDCEKIEKGE